MNKLSIASVSALVAAFVVATWLAACKGKKSGPDCAAALEHAMQVSRAELAAMDAPTVARIQQASLARCIEDRWSAEALACLGEARTGSDLGACEGKQTADQRDKLAKAIAATTSTGDLGAGGSGGGSGSGSSPAPLPSETKIGTDAARATAGTVGAAVGGSAAAGSAAGAGSGDGSAAPGSGTARP